MRSLISRKTLIRLAVPVAIVAGFSVCTQANQPTLLQQLSSETQQLYDKVHLGIVRVQLPTPQWLAQVNEQEKLLHRWGDQLAPDVRQQLLQERDEARSEQYRLIGAVASSQPTESASTQATAISPAQTIPNGFPSVNRIRPVPTGKLVLVATGLLINHDGYVVVPLYVDRPTVGNSPLNVRMGDGKLTTARFVGSDPLTKLTVIQLENHDGAPATISRGRPDEGSLTLVLSADGGARLVVWTNQHPEPGLIVTADGSIAGFGFNDRLLTAATCKPIVDQIIATGQVRRAVLGVMVREVRKDDPLRQNTPELGAKPAILVENVEANSPAQLGGLRPGDLILAVGGEAVGETETFAAIIATRRGKTDLQILRDSGALTLPVDLQPR
jgi:S1-C subfamily serine protease